MISSRERSDNPQKSRFKSASFSHISIGSGFADGIFTMTVSIPEEILEIIFLFKAVNQFKPNDSIEIIADFMGPILKSKIGVSSFTGFDNSVEIVISLPVFAMSS